MAPQGYIYDKLDIKMLELYILAHAAGPLPPNDLADLTMWYEGVGYFDFAESTAELVKSGNLTESEEGYAITDKGRENSAACESSLPFSVKRHCDQALVPVNAILRRNAQVRGEKRPTSDGSVIARLTLDDDKGNLLTVELLCPSVEQADRLIANFRARPERVYHKLLSTLDDEDSADA